MKNFLISVLCLLIIVSAFQCKKSPYVPKSEIEHIRDSTTNAKSIENICFIYNNDVYFLDKIENTPQKITATSTNTKTRVRISHNLQKIAYINSEGHPEIIDRNGNIINTLTAYSTIKDMDWSADDATLYMLIGSQFYYYGPVIVHPSIDFIGIPIGGGEPPQILSATLSKNNDLAYVVQYYTFDGYVQEMILKKNDGSGSREVVGNSSFPHLMQYVKFSTHAKDLLVGYGDEFGIDINNPKLSKLEVYTDMKNYPDMEILNSSFCEYIGPIYRGDKQCLVSAFNINEIDSDSYYLNAYFTNDLESINKTEYNNATSDLSVDWK